MEIVIVALIASLFAPKEISDCGLNHIKKYEGLRLEQYECPAGKPTIGYGHQSSRLSTITKKQAEELLRSDLAPIEEHINSLGMMFTQSQFDVMCSFAFNIGLHNFKRSTFSETLDPGELKKWVYADKKKLPGLVKRRDEEFKIFVDNLHSCCSSSGVYARQNCVH